MKGFIEVTEKNGDKYLIGVNTICEIHDRFIVLLSYNTEVKETYSELKALIEGATEESKSECDDCPYNDARVELPRFEGTREALDRLSIRKEEQV